MSVFKLRMTADDQRTFEDLVGQGVPNQEVVDARRCYTDALTAEICQPVEICIAARALQNAHARAGWTLWQSRFDFREFHTLEVAAHRSYEARLGSSTNAVVGAIADGLGLHVQFSPEPANIEALVPFTAVNAEADAFDRAHWEEVSWPTAPPTSYLPASLEVLATQEDPKPQGRFANVRNAIGSFLRRPVR